MVDIPHKQIENIFTDIVRFGQDISLTVTEGLCLQCQNFVKIRKSALCILKVVRIEGFILCIFLVT